MCVSTFLKNVLPTSSGRLNLVRLDAAVIEKFEEIWPIRAIGVGEYQR
jgi:hypothetical protein